MRPTNVQGAAMLDVLCRRKGGIIFESLRLAVLLWARALAPIYLLIYYDEFHGKMVNKFRKQAISTKSKGKVQIKDTQDCQIDIKSSLP